MSINRVSLSGNLTRDPELRTSSGGVSFLNFGLAVNENRKNRDTGEWEPYANFVDCVAIGKRAEGLAKFLTKGMKVAVAGKLSYSRWETQDGEKRSKLEVVVDEVDVMSARRDGGSPNEQSAERYSGHRDPVDGSFPDDGEDIPF